MTTSTNDQPAKKNRLGVAASLAQPAKPAAESTNAPAKNVGGRPPKTPTERIHLAIEGDVVEYLRVAWRTHKRPDGTLAESQADLIEDLLREHKAKHGAS